MMSVLNSFAPSREWDRRPENCPLYVGSVKSSVGHGEAAAGVTSLIKVLLMLQHNIIPPHNGIKTEINRSFPSNLSSRGVHIAKQPLGWKPSLGAPRRAIVNNFSAAGGNTAMLIQEPPEKSMKVEKDPREYHIIAISAKSMSALEANARNFLSLIGSMAEDKLSMSSLSYTTTARRVHHPHRIAVSGSTNDQLTQTISKAIEARIGEQKTLRSPEIVFAFTGQGSHYLGMGNVLYSQIASFRADIRRYDQISCGYGFPSILPVVTYSRGETTTSSLVALQLAVTCLQMALVRMWKAWGIEPRAVVGHSLGHYAALNAAGVLSEVDTIFLVGLRAQMINTTCQPWEYCMLSIALSEASVAPFLAGSELEIACLNGPEQVVVGGSRGHIEGLQLDLASKGTKSTILHTAHAYHTSQMECVLESLKQGVKGTTFRRPSIPIICPLNAAVVDSEGVFGTSHVADHLRKPVKFLEALRQARETGLVTSSTMFLEIGPNPVVCKIIKLCLSYSSVPLASLDQSVNTWGVLTRTLSAFYMAGAHINWVEYHRDFARFQEVLPMASYAWDLSSHWIAYRNDWSLRKGDPPPECRCYGSNIPSTTVHEIVEETFNKEGASVTVESDLSCAELSTIIQGHEVDGLPLCTPVRKCF